MTVTDTINPASTTPKAVTLPPLITSVADRRFGGIPPMSSNNKPPPKFPYNNNNTGNNSRPSVSTPRVAVSQRPASSNSLHPNVTTRSPRSARKGRAETICSPESQLHAPISGSGVARPSSATGSRISGTPEGHHQPSPTLARPSLQRQNSTASSAAPKFFRADQARPPKSKQQGPPPLSSSKFFFSDGVPTASPRALSPTPSFSARIPAGQNNLTGLAIDLGPGSNSSYASGPPSLVSRSSSIRGSSGSRPSSAVSQPVPPTPHSAVLETRNHVKFVYANGTEEILPPRRMGSEVGSAVTPNQVIPNQSTSNQTTSSPFSTSPINTLSPVNSPNPVANPQSPFFRSPHSSPRSSMDGTTRHGRALSIGSTVDIINLLKGESGPDDKDGNENPQAAAKAKIKAMEEAAANARRERKVLDLEISNTSLMAINKTLERQMRKQTAEIRRYRRLARSGRLQPIPSKKFSSHLYEDELFDSDTTSAPEWEASGAEEEDGEEEDDESSPGGENDGEGEEGKTSEANFKKNNSHDRERLDLDLSKHQALLEASAKMNVSLKRCQYIAEQLINEGRKALEYKVQPSDVQLGGRVLSGDHDEEDEEGERGEEGEEDEESDEGESEEDDDGEDEDDEDSGSEATEDESEEDDDEEGSDEGSDEEFDDDDQDEEESSGDEEDEAESLRLAGYTAAQAGKQQAGVRGSA